MSSTTVSESDAGKEVVLKPGDMLVISLDETPGTGYRWALAHGVPEILRLVESGYVAPAGEQLGKPGRHRWTFEAGTTGNARLVLKRSRAWAADDLTVGTFEIDVRITP
jgi:predicted secreted protein